MKGKLNFPGADAYMQRFFREVDSVVWDIMSGSVGVVTDEGVATLTKTTTDGVDDYRINVNPIGEQFAMPLPAFAQATPVAGIKEGDIIVRGARDKISFIVKVVGGGKFRVMNVDGTETSWTAPNTTFLGLDSGVMVLRSLISMTGGSGGGFDQMKSMLLPMMMMGGGDSVSEMLPMMLMMGGGATNPDGTPAASPFGAGNMAQMMQTMMMMKMMKGDSGSSTPLLGSKAKTPFN